MSLTQIIHVVEDDPIVRASLHHLLENENFCVTTHASALDFFAAIGTCRMDCVVSDMAMPGMDGLELLSQMKRRHLASPVIVITGCANVALAVNAMKEGAVDLLEKPIRPDELIAAVRKAVSEANRDVDEGAAPPRPQPQLAGLSAREKQVLTQIVNGKQNKVIARTLGISYRTVENHRASIMRKTRAGTLSDLLRMVLTAEAV